MIDYNMTGYIFKAVTEEATEHHTDKLALSYSYIAISFCCKISIVQHWWSSGL